VRKGKYLIVSFLMIGLVGCGDSKQRRAGRNILDELDKAQRRYQRALALMANPVYTIAGEYAPLKKHRDASPAEIKLPPVGTLNPKAFKVLVDAGEGLEAVLAANKAAPATDKALAKAMLGRIGALKGRYKGILASQAREKAGEAVGRADRAASLMRVHAAMIAYYDKLLSLGDTDVRATLAGATGDVNKLAGQIRKIDEELDATKAQQKALTALNEKLTGEARDRRRDSRLTEGREALDLLAKAQAKQSQINKNTTTLSRLEIAKRARTDKRGRLELELKLAKRREKTAQDILKSRSTQFRDNTDRRQEMQKALEQARKSAQETARQVVEAQKEAAKAEKDAAGFYDEAIKWLADARSELPGRRDPAALAEEAEVQMAWAGVKLSSLELQQDCDRLAAVMEKNGAPQIAADLRSYPGDSDAQRQEARKRLLEAVGLCEKAVSAAAGDMRSTYRVLLASAYYDLYRCSDRQDQTFMDKASAALDDAAKDTKAPAQIARIVSEMKKLKLLSP